MLSFFRARKNRPKSGFFRNRAKRGESRGELGPRHPPPGGGSHLASGGRQAGARDAVLYILRGAPPRRKSGGSARNDPQKGARRRAGGPGPAGPGRRQGAPSTEYYPWAAWNGRTECVKLASAQHGSRRKDWLSKARPAGPEGDCTVTVWNPTWLKVNPTRIKRERTGSSEGPPSGTPKGGERDHPTLL